MSRFSLFRKSLASSIAFNAAGKRFLRWQGKVGHHYFIQISDSDDHLRKWKWAPIRESGKGPIIEHEMAGNADQAFFRLAYTTQTIPAGKTLSSLIPMKMASRTNGKSPTASTRIPNREKQGTKNSSARLTHLTRYPSPQE